MVAPVVVRACRTGPVGGGTRYPPP
jgi:hypothetical protein